MQLTPRGPIALIGTLDTKGGEVGFLRERLQALGLETLVIDVGIAGVPLFEPDVKREEIALRGGVSIETLLAGRDRGRAVVAMQSGLTSWMLDSFGSRRLSGVLGIGGSAGTSIAATAMRQLPLGVPKLIVSTSASGDTRPHVGTSDIVMMPSVADLAGLNRITRTVLTNAANAIAGMCCLPPAPALEGERPCLGATMFGVTTPCVTRVRELVEEAGYTLLVFSANGVGGRVMEQLIRDHMIEGVIDITTTELADELGGGILTAGPDRLEQAGRSGIPQVISVGALDMVNFGPMDTVPEKFRGRTLYRHNSAVTLMRTTCSENAILGQQIAEKANMSRGPVTIVLPLRGVSAIDCPGQPFHDPNADHELFEAIRNNIGPKVKLVEVDAHINDPAFATQLVAEYLELKERKSNDLA
jgi:uncharacterized protein (UPF0261 family)